MSKHLLFMAVLLLAIACSGAAPATQEPTATAVPTPTPEPTATPTPAPTPEPTPVPTATPAPPAEETQRIAVLVDPRLTAIMEKMEPVEPVWTVYFHSDDWRIPGRNTLVDDVFQLVKLENIATHEGYQEISPETIVSLEPDIIVADSIESIVENPDLSGLHMVKETDHIPHHIFVLSDGLSFSLNNPHFMEAVEELAVFSYPEAFPEEEAGGHDHEAGEGHSH